MFRVELAGGGSLEQNLSISSASRLASDSVSLPRFDNPQGVSGNPQTMSGLSSVPNGHRFTDNIKPREPNSPASAIENRADADSDSGFARLCFVQRCHKGTHTKVLKLSAGLRTQSVECSKLGKTRIITDASCGMVRNTGFCGQNLPPHVYLELLSIYFL